ncbi:zf-C3HC4-domain-containing protein [Neolentinus lepideus HHB14362 ss-1]|uniref:Zf-C3HC4-domain-containing protein n=1 Tax=Neolentinus lepideus HHB14362 ss-1 TaxID=1314782 RepID=A0A165W3P4_9AGAM|nr:zf-C3HC4-domain-containing protein [Neolentinus lepideus HHB14362 ss-1]
MSDETLDEKQCRICLDGPDLSLGRLIRPCQCRGSISYVHVKCLQRWRNSSETAFFACPQCKYRYHFARTRVSGLATNPVVVGAVSTMLFTILVLCSSFITTYFLSSLEDDSGDSYYYISYWPYDAVKDIIRAAIRILQDSDAIADNNFFTGQMRRSRPTTIPTQPPGLLKRFVQRFLLGLPVVGAGSLVHMLLSMPFPIGWIARYRASRSRRGGGDFATIIIVVLIIVGAARTLLKVYSWTQRFAQRLLLRAEDAILEVG